MMIKHMRRKTLSHAHLTCEGFLLRLRLVTASRRGDLKRGIRGRLRNSSPLVSLLDKRVFKFKVRIFKREICYFVNFKIPFTRKN